MAGQLPPPTANKLEQLRKVLDRLPAKSHSAGPGYPFELFVVDDEWVELTGSVQGSINHTLEVVFGSRHNGQPIQFKSHGPDLLAVVDVLSAHITGLDGENPILVQWIEDLHQAALRVLEQDPKRERKPSAKQEQLNEDSEKKNQKHKKKAAQKTRAKKAKARTEEEFLWDPEDLRPAERSTGSRGRKPDPLLDLLTEYVEAISDSSVKRWRCSAHAAGCAHSIADPRNSPRVYTHAMECKFLDPDLVERAAEAFRGNALGAQIEALDATEATLSGKAEDGTQPSVYAEARAAGRRNRSLKYNHLVLQAVCGLSLPPSILDNQLWHDLVDFLDPHIDRKSGTTMATALIPAEAARARQLSIQTLRKHQHLTLSFDGATSRRNQSIYTIHATTPDTRDAHLLSGHSATGISHTGDYLKGVLLKTIEEVGPQHFSAIVSDSTGNTRLARELVADVYPWLIVLPDCCHHMNNAAKDICDLDIFADANLKLRAVIRFFRQSSYATHHLTAWRRILGVAKGLVSIGNTRFLTLYYAIASLLPCINIIVDLVKSGVLATNSSHPLFWLCDKPQVRAFKDMLHQEKAILEPLARSVKCLESSTSTIADVTLFWLATQATLNDLFTDPYKRGELMLTEETIRGVRSIMNGRFAQMIQGPNRRMYPTALFLDPFHLGSKLFTRKNINPLAATINIPGHTAAPRNTPDADLRLKIPQYEPSGAYLMEFLVHEMNAGRVSEVFRRFTTPDEVFDEFRLQYANYVRQTSPFDRYLDSASPLEYWQKLFRHPDAQLLAYLVNKLYSVVSNSMAEERTVSNFTKLNAPDRGRQRSSTLVYMTQVRQHMQRETSSGKRLAPTVRFRDMTDLLKSSGKVPIDLRGTGLATLPSGLVTDAGNDDEVVEMDNPHSTPAGELSLEDWEKEAGLDEAIEPAEAGATDRFEVEETDGINLSEPFLLDLLSDTPVPGASVRKNAVKKRAALDTDPMVEDSGSRKRLTPGSYSF